MANTWQCARCATQNDETAVSCTSCGLIRGGVVVASDAATTAPAAASAPPPSQGSWPAAPMGATPPPPMGGAYPPAGADPAAPGGWPGAPVAQQPQGAGKQVAKGILANVGARVIVIAAIVIIAGVAGLIINAGRDANGTITKSGEVPVTELKLGDCYDLQDPNASFDENAVISKTTGKPCKESHHYEVFLVGTYSSPSGSTAYPTTSQFDDWAGANCVSAFEAYVGTPIDQSSLTFFVFFPDEPGWKQGDRGMQCSLADGNNKALTQSMKGSGY